MDEILVLYADKNISGIILTSGNITMYYSYSSNNTKLLKTIKADLPNKHKTGGQSAQRFERIRNEKINHYIKKICEYAVELYCENGLATIEGLYIAGNAEIKNIVIASNLFQQYFNKKIMGVYTVNEIQSNTIYQITEKISTDAIKSYVDEIDEMLSNESKFDYVVVGNKCMQMLENWLIKELYITQNLLDTISHLVNTKIKINIVDANDTLFINKYGEIVGITWYTYEDYTDDQN